MKSSMNPATPLASLRRQGAVVGLAKSLNLDVVAEGIETEEQLAFLRQLNCRAGQGYLFSRPVSPDDLEKLLRG